MASGSTLPSDHSCCKQSVAVVNCC